MKNTFRFLVIALGAILFCMPVYSQEQAKKKVAVYMTGSTSDEAYKKVIGAKLVNAITESGEYAAVERTADFLAALSAENDYQASGEVRDSQIARLGQKFGVRYVVVADASELFDEYFITARLINVETGLVEKACDASGPAESMAQLVALSQNIAKGLLNTSVSSVSGLSTEPIHLSLCAIKDNNLVFIKPAQWQTLNEQEKALFEKKGICIIYGKDVYIVAMYDIYGDWYFGKRNHAPSYYQLGATNYYSSALNNAFKIFGGQPLDFNKFYISTEECSNGKIWAHDFSSSTSCQREKNDIYNIRLVYTIQDIINENPLLW